jgi:hypothetical protein
LSDRLQLVRGFFDLGDVGNAVSLWLVVTGSNWRHWRAGPVGSYHPKKAAYERSLMRHVVDRVKTILNRHPAALQQPWRLPTHLGHHFAAQQSGC